MLTRMAPLMTRMARMARMLTRMTRWLAGSHIIHTRRRLAPVLKCRRSVFSTLHC